MVKKSLLRKCANLVIHTGLMDSHLYLCAHWVLDLIANRPEFSSFQAELLPYVVKNQFNPKLQRYSRKCTKNSSTLAAVMNHTPLQDAADESYRCFCVIAAESAYCARANTVNTYFAMNRAIGCGAKYEYTPWSSADEHLLEEAQASSPKAQLGSQCVIGR